MQNSKPITDLTIGDLKQLIREAVEEAINMRKGQERARKRELQGQLILEYIKTQFDPDRVISHEDLRRRLSGKGSKNWAQDIIRDREERI